MRSTSRLHPVASIARSLLGGLAGAVLLVMATGSMQASPLGLAAAAVPRIVERSVVQEQTGQLGHYEWTPTHITSVEKQQVGGRHATYAYSGRTLHLTWADPWVPPTDDPAWVPYIKSHYFHPVSTRVAPTHEYR